VTSLLARWNELAERPGLVRGATAVAVAVGSVLVAYFVARGDWFLLAGAALALPIGLWFHRNPLVALGVWLAVDPFLQEVQANGTGRKFYWLFHRALPIAILGLIVVARLAGLTRRRLTLGWLEVVMAGYLVASILSIQFSSPTVLATSYHLYDRVAVPMAVYLLVRWYPPGRRSMEAAVPIVAFLLLFQLGAGFLQWFAPDLVPRAWLGRVGSRTTGSLGHPNVYGTSVLAAGAFLFHMGQSMRRPPLPRWIFSAAFGVSIVAAFVTLSRASWLAAFVALAGMALVHRRAVAKLCVAMSVVAVIVVLVTPVEPLIERAVDRFYSEQSQESALSRLPVVLASVRMFEAKPVTGWGFGNFDLYDRQFQGRVGELFVPDKDHASHNLYLTILAEQGLIGIVLYLGPVLILLAKTPAAYRGLAREGPTGRSWLVVLWLIPAMHFVVNNFSNMKVPFGLGLYWLSIGLIAGIVLPRKRLTDQPPAMALLGFDRDPS
jgi:O-antigen ligase